MLRLKVGCKNSCSKYLRMCECLCACAGLSVVCNSWTFRNLHKFRYIPPCVGKLWIYRILHETLPFAWARRVCRCVQGCVLVCVRASESVSVCVLIASKGLHGAGMCIWIFYKPRCPIELYVVCVAVFMQKVAPRCVRVCVCVAHASVGQQVIVCESVCVCRLAAAPE